MPLADPNTLTSADWANIQQWLRLMWFFFPLIIIFAFSMLIAHAFIPSGVTTGHLPPATRLLRLPLTIVGLLALAGALVFIVQASLFLPGALENIWDRFFI